MAATLTPHGMAQALAVDPALVDALWPDLEPALSEICEGWPAHRIHLAALATVRVECPTLEPMREHGDARRFVSLYWDNPVARRMLGNRTPSDATVYYGRGLIQLTGYDNYLRTGVALDLDLVGDPDLALQPENAVRIFAHFFHRCAAAAGAMQWTRVRELVNGGHNGLRPFLQYVQRLALGAGMSEEAAAAGEQLARVAD